MLRLPVLNLYALRSDGETSPRIMASTSWPGSPKKSHTALKDAPVNLYLVGGLEHFIFPYIGDNHPHWLIFFREIKSTHQIFTPISPLICHRMVIFPFLLSETASKITKPPARIPGHSWSSRSAGAGDGIHLSPLVRAAGMKTNREGDHGIRVRTLWLWLT